MVPQTRGETDIIFCHFWSFIALSPHNQQNQNFEKMAKKKTPGDITILQMCTKNDNHMMYGS